MVLASVPVLADDTKHEEIQLPPAPALPAGEPDVGPAISPMYRGQVAPFTGILLSPRAVAILTVNITSFPQLVKIEVDRAVSTCEAKSARDIENQRITLDTDKKILQAKLDDKVAESVALNDMLKSSTTSSTETALWVGGGFLIGALTTMFVAWGVKKAAQ